MPDRCLAGGGLVPGARVGPPPCRSALAVLREGSGEGFINHLP